jgi:hypothetical protein
VIDKFKDTRQVRTVRNEGWRAHPLHRAAMIACVVILAWFSGWPAANARAADDTEPLESRVKAAFLYKFAGFVEWPASSFAGPGTPVTIAVIGAEPIAAELSQMVSGRTVNNRPISVKRLKAGESLAGVHVLFVGADAGSRLNQIAQAAQSRSILTVTESAEALAQGSIINFVIADRRVRFEISLGAAEKSRLKLSSRLLAVAQQVRTGTP